MKFSGEKLREIRGERGFATQSDLAKAIGVSQNSISKWEAGISDPGREHLEKLYKCLKVTKKDLFVSGESQSDIREIIREEVRSAMYEAGIKASSNIPDDIAEMISRIKDDSIWEALRAVLKPYLRLRDRNR